MKTGILGSHDILDAVRAFKDEDGSYPEGTPRIWIDDFKIERLNPNSYNLRLSDTLLVYTEFPLNPRKDNPTQSLLIPPEGFVLEPGRLYLGRTVELTETHNAVPRLEGRSSYGRLGLSVHVTAGFGDAGFCGTWTLEITVIHPLRIFAGSEVCQICYHHVGEHIPYGAGTLNSKYQNQREVTASRAHQDLERNNGG